MFLLIVLACSQKLRHPSEDSQKCLCIGQNDLDSCKNLIPNVDNINCQWEWSDFDIGYDDRSTIYLTMDHTISDNSRNIILVDGVHLTLRSQNIFIRNNGVNAVVAQSSTSKITVVPNGDLFAITYEEAPTNFDLTISVERPFKLALSLPSGYTKNSIKMEGNQDTNININIQIRKQFYSLVDVFNKPETITFSQITDDNNYDAICYSDDTTKCTNVLKKKPRDFIQVTTEADLYNYEKNALNTDDLAILIFKPFLLSMENSFQNSKIFFFGSGAELNFDVPDKTIIYFYKKNNRLGIQMITETKSLAFFLLDNDVICKLNVKDTVYLDIEENYYNLPFIPNVEFVSDKSQVDIIANTDFGNRFDANYNQEIGGSRFSIKVKSGLSITSPLPNLLGNAFGSTTITSSGTCVYLDEAGKSQCGSTTSVAFSDNKNKDIATKNIVIATGSLNTITIPEAWSNDHNYIFLSSETSGCILDSVSHISYYYNGVKINQKHFVVAGNLFLNPEESVDVIVNNFQNELSFSSYIVLTIIDCSNNAETSLHVEQVPKTNNEEHGFNDVGASLSHEDSMSATITFIFYIYKYDTSHKVIAYFNSQSDYSSLMMLGAFAGDSNGLEKIIGAYSTICFASTEDSTTKCPTYHTYHVSDVSSLLQAIKSYSYLPVIIAKDLIIPESTFDFSFKLLPYDSNIKISISSPFSVYIDEDEIKFGFKNYEYVSIRKPAKIIANVKDSLSLVVLVEEISSELTFNLIADVTVNTNSQITCNFQIEVIKNNFHLYVNDADYFNGIFGTSIDEYKKICAYEDENAEESCGNDNKGSIDNVFTNGFQYNNVVIFLSTDTKTLTLPKVSSTVNVIILSHNFLTIDSVDSVQLNSNSIIINDFWIFRKDSTNLILKLAQTSSITIPDVISYTINLKLQLANSQSTINLKDCASHDKQLFEIVKFGDSQNSIEIISTSTSFNNFKNLLSKYDGITLTNKKINKYLCICPKSDSTCQNNCKGSLSGDFTYSDQITSDPGEDVEIRVFSNVEIDSSLFTKEHKVTIDQANKLILYNVLKINENIDDLLKVDNLLFSNGDNLLLKPLSSTLEVTAGVGNEGCEFTIEFSSKLALFLMNSDTANVKPSKINVKGKGELNLHKYPINKIEAVSTVSIIKGIYLICNSNNGQNDVCSYKTFDDYHVISAHDTFPNTFDANSKIYVILTTFTKDIEVDVNVFGDHQVVIAEQQAGARILEDQNKLKVISTTTLTNRADATSKLEGETGKMSLSNEYADSVVIGFNNKLTVKQEGNINNKLRTITVQPMSQKASIVIDDSVDLQKQKLQVQTENGITLTVQTNDKTVDENTIKNFVEIPDEVKDKVTLIVGDDTSSGGNDGGNGDGDGNNGGGNGDGDGNGGGNGNGDGNGGGNGDGDGNGNNDPNDGSGKDGDDDKGLTGGQIAGIVVGVIAAVAIIAVIIFFVIKKKKKAGSENEDSNEGDDNLNL